MRKIFEEKYLNQEEAIKDLKEKGWHYIGRKGLFTKYDLYEGITIYRRNVEYYDPIDDDEYDTQEYYLAQILNAHLSSDGQVTVYQDSRSPEKVVLGGNQLPTVKTTFNVFEYIEKEVGQLRSFKNLVKNAYYNYYDKVYVLHLREGNIEEKFSNLEDAVKRLRKR